MGNVKGWCYCKHNDATGEYIEKDGHTWFKCDCGMRSRVQALDDVQAATLSDFYNKPGSVSVDELGKTLTDNK